MKSNRNYLKITLALILVVFLYSFTNERNNKKTPAIVEVKILDSDNLFVTQPMVNKLLIQNNVKVTNIAKEKLVLNKLEEALNSNKMVVILRHKNKSTS